MFQQPSRFVLELFEILRNHQKSGEWETILRWRNVLSFIERECLIQLFLNIPEYLDALVPEGHPNFPFSGFQDI